MEGLLNQIIAQLKYIPRALLMTLLLSFVYLFIRDNGKKTVCKLKMLFSEKWVLTFIFYSAYMITSTIFVRYWKAPYLNVFSNLYFKPGDTVNNNEIIKNALFFIPFSFLYLQAFKPRNAIRSSMLVTVCATTFVELSQLVFWCGEFQVADLLNNFIGGILGCIIWKIIQWIWRIGNNGNS